MRAVAAGAPHAVGVTWTDNSSNEEGFRFERSADGGTAWVAAGTTAANIQSGIDTGVASEVRVCYRVVAFSGKGDSPPSNTACVTPIAGPTDLADRMGLLTWTDNAASEDGYEVWVMDAFGPAYDGLIATLPPNTTSYQTGGCALWCHGFGVIAFKNDTHSDWATVMLPPGVPVNLTVAAVSAGQIDLAWADQPNAGELPAQQFEIERCTGDASACGDAAFQIASFALDTTFRDLQVLPGTTYTYRVRGWINVLHSNPSNTATPTVP
ncbi:MAG: fibronectin type III domain-containing protein [Chloroflexi bacterium]|nr:MAG: fibronectin type III domain-containing protein [Chloroflexota bacterium]